jgi:serine/threonine protein kinase
MITGEHPWSGYDQIQAMYQIGLGCSDPLSYLRERDENYQSSDMDDKDLKWYDNLPPTALDFLDECFATDPNRRSSARQLSAHQLVLVSEQQPI